MNLLPLLASEHGPLHIIENFPLFSIILAFIGVVIASLTSRRFARATTLIIEAIVVVLNTILIFHMHNYEGGYIEYAMGHFAAPFGNEIRIGSLEAMLTAVFAFVMICCVLGGDKHLKRDIPDSKINYFYVLFKLWLSGYLY